MIKIGKSINELDILAGNFYNEVESKLNLNDLINYKIINATNNKLNEETIFYKYILKEIQNIIIAKPSELEGLAKKIGPLYNALETFRISLLPSPSTDTQRRGVRKLLKQEVFSIFNYDFFTTYNSGKWAYDHAASLDLKVCPYCNSQYTFTIKTSRGKTRPQFDHFFTKSSHPYFSLSFYNLIPSCYICNANLKGSKSFKPSTYIHPFIEGTEDSFHFKTNISKVDYLMGKKDFDIVLRSVPTANPDKAKRALKSAEVFHIEELYAFHKDYAGEIILKSYIYTDTKIRELIEEFNLLNGSNLFSSKTEIVEMLFGNHLVEENLHKRVLAKLTKNIANELGIKL